MNTPVYPGSTENAEARVRRSSATSSRLLGPPYYGANIEDGIALLDERGQGRTCRKVSPTSRSGSKRGGLHDRCARHRLKPEVLPLGNLAGAMPPYWLQIDARLAFGAVENYLLSDRHLADTRPYATVTG
jgi:hypothetical protein